MEDRGKTLLDQAEGIQDKVFIRISDDQITYEEVDASSSGFAGPIPLFGLTQTDRFKQMSYISQYSKVQ